MRRRAPLAASHGTTIPTGVRIEVNARDRGCVGRLVGLPGECGGSYELDHVRASGGIGMKSPSVASNLVRLCSVHHDWKTHHGREVRPLLVAYLDTAMEKARVIG